MLFLQSNYKTAVSPGISAVLLELTGDGLQESTSEIVLRWETRNVEKISFVH